MKKIPYEVLSIQVERMYAKTFPEGDLKAIDKHCKTIEALIEGSGWDMDEYLNRWFADVDGKHALN